MGAETKKRVSTIMRAAENAAKVVASWSKSKQEYANRVLNQQLSDKQ